MTKLDTTNSIECTHIPQLLHRIFSRSPKTKDAWMECIFCADSSQWVIAGYHCIRCLLWMAHSLNNYTVLYFHQIRHWYVNSKWFFMPSFASSHFMFGFCIRLNVICVTNEIGTRSFDILMEVRQRLFRVCCSSKNAILMVFTFLMGEMEQFQHQISLKPNTNAWIQFHFSPAAQTASFFIFSRFFSFSFSLSFPKHA